MHGLVNKGLQGFLTTIYGEEVWADVARSVELPNEGFEALLKYDPSRTWDVLKAASKSLGKDIDTLLEDLGTFLVSDASTNALRRLLRFGGADFADFVQSIDELPDRSRMAIPTLTLPELTVNEIGADEYEIVVCSEFGRFGKVLTGILRAMADDYGCLSLIEWESGDDGREVVTVRLLDGMFAEGRAFALSGERA